MAKEDIRIGVIGSGSVGSIVATRLTDNGYNVEYLYDRRSEIMVGDKQQMTVIDGENSCSSLVSCVSSVDGFSGKKDIIFLLGRSTDMTKHMDYVMDSLSDNGFVVMLNNTLCRRCVTARLAVNRIVGMMIGWSCIRNSDAESEIISSGDTYVGVYAPDAVPLANLVVNMFNEFMPTKYIDNFNDVVLGRVVLNSAIACLGALSGLRLKDFLHDKYGKRLFIELVKEGYHAYTGIGIVPVDYDGKLDYQLFCGDTLKSKRYRKAVIGMLVKFNGETRSSILLDLQNNKKAETEYFIGKIVETATKNHINCKFSQNVYKKINQIEASDDTIREELLKIVYKECKDK